MSKNAEMSKYKIVAFVLPSLICQTYLAIKFDSGIIWNQKKNILSKKGKIDLLPVLTSIHRKCLSYNSIQQKSLSYNFIHQVYGENTCHTIFIHFRNTIENKSLTFSAEIFCRPVFGNFKENGSIFFFQRMRTKCENKSVQIQVKEKQLKTKKYKFR